MAIKHRSLSRVSPKHWIMAPKKLNHNTYNLLISHQKEEKDSKVSKPRMHGCHGYTEQHSQNSRQDLQTNLQRRSGWMHRCRHTTCQHKVVLHLLVYNVTDFMMQCIPLNLSWNYCNQRTRFIVIWKHFRFILSTATRIWIDSVMCPRSSSRGCNTSASVTVTVQ